MKKIVKIFAVEVVSLFVATQIASGIVFQNGLEGLFVAGVALALAGLAGLARGTASRRVDGGGGGHGRRGGRTGSSLRRRRSSGHRLDSRLVHPHVKTQKA